MRMFLYKQKRKIIKNIEFIHFLIRTYYNNYFNPIVREQKKNPKKIPIIIISFNQLFYLKQLVDFLKKHQYSNIVIIDNNSTYPPLLDYFDSIESSVTLHRLNENLGHLVFWKNKELFEKYSKGYYVVTDADIVPVENCPDDFLKYFIKILNSYPKITKVGFSLKIDNIPESNLSKNKIIKWEKRFWVKMDKKGNYISAIDTTFALYRPSNVLFDTTNFFNAIRTNSPYQALHGGWYLDTNALNDEQKFYFKNANESSSWKTDESGNVISEKYS